jgi:hypothetical protein
MNHGRFCYSRKSVLGLIVFALFYFFPLSAQSQQSMKPKPGKEIELFNGKDFTGWTYFLADPQLKLEDVWSVDATEKLIICKGKPFGYLRTVKDYTNFILKLQWRFNPITKLAGNSGVFLRATGPDKIWPRLLEAQLLSGNAGDFYLNGGKKLETDPKFSDTKSPATVRRHFKNSEKPAGEWNQYEILCDGGHIVLKINGELVNEGTGAEIEPGKICLQSEGVEIQFRDLRLTPLE